MTLPPPPRYSGPIIDGHVHIYPDHIAPRAVENVCASGTLKNALSGTADDLQRAMQTHGITAAWNMPLALDPAHERGVNHWAAECHKNASPIFSLGSIHPDSPDPEKTLCMIRDLGLPGIKLHPEYQAFSPDESRMEPIYSLCETLGLVILFHAGDDLAFSGKPRSHPRQFAQINDRHPRLKMILAHLGGLEFLDDPASILAGRPNLWFDLAYILPLFPSETLTRVIRHFGVDRVLYGSDSPWMDYTTHLNAFFALPFTAEEQTKILFHNIQSVLPLPRIPTL